MERLLRRKFVCVAMGVITAVLLAIAVVINVTSFLQVGDMADEVIGVLADNGGAFPKNFDRMPFQHMTQETPFSTRYFLVRFDGEKSLLNVDTRNVMMVNAQQAENYAQSVWDGGKTQGFADNYRYQIVRVDSGYLLIFVDCAQELSAARGLLVSSVVVCAIALLAVLALSVLLSKQAVAPIVESYRRQQQFITNVTHELKTPLAIVKTNTEVMELSQGVSQWSQSIHNQIQRLNGLVNHLVTLCKMEEDGHGLVAVDFSLSDATEETVASFAVMAGEKGLCVRCDIAPCVTYCGEEQSLRLLVSILMDNAVKYGDATAPIAVKLEPVRGKMRLQVSNGARDLHPGNYDAIFGRFYRLDASRNSQQGGFGIGLAMAQTIVRNHGGTIQAKSPDGKTLEVTVEL